jgi:hypothetical protein
MPEALPPDIRRPNPLAVITALGALGLLLVLLFFQSGPDADLPANQRPMAMALVGTMMTNGVLVNYDCAQSRAWVNRAVWDGSNNEQKRNMIIGLATVCESRNAGYRISIIDYDTRSEIAGFDGKQVRFAGR